MARLVIISSGSKNNAALIENKGKTILLDCGVSLRSLRVVYQNLSLDINDLAAVLVTHRHDDHIKNLKTLKRSLSVPFYSGCEVEDCESFSGTLNFDGFEITPVACSHDVPCCGYLITAGGKTLCVATDTGVVTKDLALALDKSDAALLESNHDVQMLKMCGYPDFLKRRILSDKGHLSNYDCAKEICRVAAGGRLKCAVLAHISENSNTQLMAKSETLCELKKYGLDDSVEIYTATPMLEVEI